MVSSMEEEVSESEEEEVVVSSPASAGCTSGPRARKVHAARRSLFRARRIVWPRGAHVILTMFFCS